jgi:hypothetical protein
VLGFKGFNMYIYQKTQYIVYDICFIYNILRSSLTGMWGLSLHEKNKFFRITPHFEKKMSAEFCAVVFSSV